MIYSRRLNNWGISCLKILLAISAVLTLLPTLVNAATWNDADIRRVNDELKKGSGINIGRKHEAPQIAIMAINSIKYIIDFRVQDCFITGYEGKALSQYSCAKIKKGYPKFGSLITWGK